jgi:hypothetical protein
VKLDKLQVLQRKASTGHHSTTITCTTTSREKVTVINVIKERKIRVIMKRGVVDT